MMLLLLFLSIAPIVIFANMIYKRDFDKEPKSILIKLFLCGIGSTFLTLFITKLLTTIVPFFGYDYSNLNAVELIPYVFVGVALIEEFSKWIFVYKLEYNDNEFNHLYDGIVYAAFVSLGFACFENILYVMSAESGITTAILRAILAIPGHLCDGIMMGYYLSMAKLAMRNNHKQLSTKNLILSLMVPTIAHGIYDYLIFASTVTNNSLFLIAFFIFVVFFYTYASKKVKQLSLSAYNLNPNYVSITHRNDVQYMSYPQQTNNMYQNQGSYQQHQQPYNGYAQQTQTPTVGYEQNNVSQNKFCPYCGTPAYGKYCSKCGKEI